VLVVAAVAEHPVGRRIILRKVADSGHRTLACWETDVLNSSWQSSADGPAQNDRRRLSVLVRPWDSPSAADSE